MRVIFEEELKQVADDLDRMAHDVRKAITRSGNALLNSDVEAAQAVIDGDTEIDRLESSVIEQSVMLLAKQNPVATDLRVIVSTLRLATTFERMGDLARHIAEIARSTYPDSALVPESRKLFQEMENFLGIAADRLITMLANRDSQIAEEIIKDDDTLDGLHRQATALALSSAWRGSNQQLVDLVLLSRFMERLGDHAVSAASRVIYVGSGFDASKEPHTVDAD